MLYSQKRKKKMLMSLWNFICLEFTPLQWAEMFKWNLPKMIHFTFNDRLIANFPIYSIAVSETIEYKRRTSSFEWNSLCLIIGFGAAIVLSTFRIMDFVNYVWSEVYGIQKFDSFFFLAHFSLF